MSKIYFSEKLLSKAKMLEYICTASTGTNHIDLNYCKNNKIKIISLKKEKKIIQKISSTAEHALTLIFAGLRNLYPAVKSVEKKKWDYRPFIGKQSNYLNFGIIGYGRLGMMVVKFLKPLAKNIFVYERNFKIKIKKNDKIKQVSLNFLLRNSDVISIHIHADEKNKEFIDKKKLNN